MAPFAFNRPTVRAHVTDFGISIRNRLKQATLLATLSLAMTIATTTVTEAQSSPDDLAAIRRHIEQQDVEIRALREQVTAQSNAMRLPPIEADPSVNGPTGLASGATVAPEEMTSLDEPKKQTSKPVDNSQYPSFKITGFTQLDTAWYSQNPKNVATVGDAQDGTGFRRARLAVLGKVAEFTNYQFEVDFATAGRPSFFDNYVEKTNMPYLGAVRAGQYLQPFSVDAMSGFRNLPFLERSLPFLAFVPFRRVGVMASNSSEDQMTKWFYSGFRTGGFNNAPLGDDRFATDIGDKGGISFSTRATHLLYYDPNVGDRYLWQIGAAFNFSRLGANDAAGSGTTGNAGSGPAPFYQSRVLPEFGTLGYPENSSSFGSAVNGTPTFVDSGKIVAKSFDLYGLETVWQSGPWSAQAEWMATVVNGSVGPIYYNGAYAEVMYRLTGEHREYDRKLSALKNPIPFTDFISFNPGGINGWGAWEIEARWSFVDIRNPANTQYLAGSNGAGNGFLTDTTLGMTWFLNAHAKVQFNWIHSMLQNTAKGNSLADLFVTRVQVDF